MEKESKTIKCSDAALVIIIFTILGVVIGYAIRKQEKNECPKSVVNINEVMDGAEVDLTSKSYEIEKKDDNYIIVEKEIKNFYDVEDLNVKEMDGYSVFSNITSNTNIVEKIENIEYDAWLDIAGHVSVRRTNNGLFERKSLNIDKVIDIIDFQAEIGDDLGNIIYMLTENGDVYSYKVKNLVNGSYDVSKVEKVSNVKKLFISYYSKVDADGSWALFAITEDNNCVMIMGS